MRNDDDEERDARANYKAGCFATEQTLTLLPLVTDDDEERDARAEAVEQYGHCAGVACLRPAHSVHRVLVGGALLLVGRISQGHDGHHDEHQEHLRGSRRICFFNL